MPGTSPISVEASLPVFSVTEISLTLKRFIEQTFDRVRVRGEISGFKRAASGHLYFALKDPDSVLDAVCWRPAAQRFKAALDNGLEVIVTGRLTSYPARSRYQILVDAIELAGAGALLKLLEDRRRKLEAEGLFAATRKRPIPYLPDVIGVVTSPTGAVIKDILHRLADRFPRPVLVWPVAVQGQGAAEQIAAAIEGFNRLPAGGPVPRPDVLIVARGGGSLEDLWAFNEEIVVRAAAASAIPLIAAVGHETDTTLIDFAADLRAPTPTAAAELAVPVRSELIARVLGLASRQISAMSRTLDERRTRLSAAARGLPQPLRLLALARQRLDDWSERFDNALTVGLQARQQRLLQASARLASPAQRIERERERLASVGRALERALDQILKDRRGRLQQASAVLASCSYERVLERGFALVLDRTGHALSSVESLTPGLAVRLRLRDGEAGARIEDKPTPEGGHEPAAESHPASRPAARRGAARGKPPGGQGSLF